MYREHLTEYLIEAVSLGLFLVSACGFAILLEHPDSLVHGWIASSLVRRGLMGLAMGATAAAIIHSPLGKRSGAHLNPAVTLTFLWLGKVSARDAIGYIAGQVAGGLAGVLISWAIWGARLAHPATNFVATTPGPSGPLVAALAEGAISFGLMLAVLVLSSSRFERFTGLVAASLVAVYITLEAPLSGMSMNPARSLGSNLLGGAWRSLWIYFVAPPVGMVLAALVVSRRARAAGCAKLVHPEEVRCIHCGHDPLGRNRSASRT